MPPSLKARLVSFLRWSERYTKTDMVYLASGGAWLTLEQVAGAFFALTLAVVFGRYASQDLYGNYKFALTLAGLLSALTLTGLGVAVTRAAARGFDGALRAGARMTLSYAWVFVLGTLAAAGYYAYAGNRFVAVALVVAAAFVPFSSAFSLYGSFLMGKKAFAASARSVIASGAFSVVAIAATLLLSQRAIAVVFASFAAQAAAAWYFYRKTSARTENSAEDPGMRRYGFHLTAMGIMGAVADKIDSLIVFTLLGPSALAVYAYAIAIPEQLKGLVKNMGAVALPRFAERSMTEIRQSIARRLVLLTMGLAATAALYALAAPRLFALLFPVYRAAVPYTEWYAPVIVLTGITATITSVLQAHQKTRALYAVSNGSAIVLVLAIGPLTYWYGIAGAIGAQALFRLTGASIALWQLTRLDEVIPQVSS